MNNLNETLNKDICEIHNTPLSYSHKVDLFLCWECDQELERHVF